MYAGNHLVAQPAPRRYFNASTGYGTLGYGLPAALGARLARPDLPVVVLVGDGGIMFTLSELATAVEEQLPVVIILWYNAGYEEIRRFMDDSGVERRGPGRAAAGFAHADRGRRRQLGAVPCLSSGDHCAMVFWRNSRRLLRLFKNR